MADPFCELVLVGGYSDGKRMKLINPPLKLAVAIDRNKHPNAEGDIEFYYHQKLLFSFDINTTVDVYLHEELTANNGLDKILKGYKGGIK